MKAALAKIEQQHEALITALDANDIGAIERAGTDLADGLGTLKDFSVAEPDLKVAVERIGRLAEAAMMRVNILSDQAKHRSDALAAIRGQAVSATYTR